MRSCDHGRVGQEVAAKVEHPDHVHNWSGEYFSIFPSRRWRWSVFSGMYRGSLEAGILAAERLSVVHTSVDFD